MKKLGYLVIALLTLVIMNISYNELVKISSLDMQATAKVIEIYNSKTREYCVYGYVSNQDMVVARDMIHNISENNVGDLVDIHYNSENNAQVSYYKLEMEAMFCGAMLIQTIFLLVVILKIVRR